MPLRNWISRNQAAGILGVSAQSVTNYAAKGLIQTRSDQRYAMYWKPEVEALAANLTFQEARVLQDRAEQIRHDAQDLLATAEAEYARRQRRFQKAFGALFPSDENLYGKLDRYQLMLAHMIDAAGIGQRDKTVLNRVLHGDTPEQICTALGYTSGYFKYLYRRALKALTAWYSSKQAELSSLLDVIQHQRQDIADLRLEKQLLAEALKDQERADAISAAVSVESRRELILRTCYPYNISLLNVGLSVRASNCARANGIDTVGQLAVIDKADVWKWRNAGRKSVQELEELLAHYGLSFGHNPVSMVEPPAESAPVAAAEPKDAPLPNRVFITDQEPWTWPLSRTGMSSHLIQLLKTAGVTTLGGLAAMSREDLAAIRGLGYSSLREAVRILRRFDIEI